MLSATKTAASVRGPLEDTSGTSQGHRPGVLLVDDQPARLLTYESVLSGLEIQCVKAHSGEEALKKLLEQEFAVVLLDVSMPGMDGFEVARVMRQHPRLEHTPIIFVTGVHVSELDRLKGYEIGAIDYIAVPVVPEILRSKVAVLTELHRRRSQLLAVNRELSEARNLRGQLREQEQRLLLANRAARLGTHDWQIHADRIAWDERTAQLWGVAPGDPVTYEVFLSGIHPEDRAGTERAVHQALDPKGDGQYCATFRVTSRQDGRTRWVEAHGQALFDNGQPYRLVGTVQDVTDRKVAADRLCESEERFRELANHIDQFAWTCEELCQVTWYNQRWYDYTGTTFEQMRGLGWTGVHDPEHLPRVMANIQRCASRGEPWEDTFPLRGRDGQYRWFLSRAVPIRSQDGRILRWFGTNTDVTQLRRLQEALEAMDRRKDEFLAMLAHELRNPVAPITSAAEALSCMLPAADGKARYCAEVIQRQASHLSRLLDDLLDVARITQGRVPLKRQTMALMSCVEQAIETAQPLIRQKEQRLTLVRPAAALFVNIDKIRMAQCVTNVLINAAKYSDHGDEILMTVSSDASHAIIEVADDGVGIPGELLPRVFDLFVQSERPLDRADGGLGIGLALCREILEMHEGTVAAASPGPDRGSTFTLRLPLAANPAEETHGRETAGPSRRRVLIVDDNRDAADIVALLLDAEGHETLAVYAAGVALAQVAAFKPHAVLLDIGLPGMDGYQLAKRMKEMTPGLRLIALSGYGQPQDKLRSRAAGFDSHLVKPVEMRSLLAALGESG